MRVAGDQANIQLCACLEAVIEGDTHDIGKILRDRREGGKGKEEEVVKDSEEDTEERIDATIGRGGGVDIGGRWYI